jgi:hypothetical protein
MLEQLDIPLAVGTGETREGVGDGESVFGHGPAV